MTIPRVAERWSPRCLVCKPPLLNHRGCFRRFFLSVFAGYHCTAQLHVVSTRDVCKRPAHNLKSDDS
eukprot:3076012-Rhodomonas_salina.1